MKLGEYLMKEKFLEIEKHLLNDEKPSIYLNEQVENGDFDEYPLSMIKDLLTVEQNPIYHPEGNVFIHAMMVVDEGATVRERSKDKKAFMWALLLHDLGKKPTTKLRKGKLTSYNHDTVGAKMAREFLEYFNQDEVFINKVISLVRWHMQILFVTKNSRFQNIKQMLEDVDVDEMILVSRCDRLGRGNLNKLKREETLKEVENFKKILKNK
jgi:putative nucleotidyltransferase with HDIG domain